jgi:Fe-S cluster assembly iron-binding protein IscA
MLQIDDDATAALAELGPLRITAEEVDGDVEVGLDEAEGPQEGDQIIERDGARVFLDATAAEVLADQVLGVHAHGDHFHFTFDDQPDVSPS